MIDFSRITKPSLLYKALYSYVALALRFIYFRKFRVVGRKNIPSDKKEGFLLICNHQLGLLDALSIIFSVAPREPVFLARGDIFEKNAGVNPISRYHFMDAYQQYEGIYGIYGGTGFRKNGQPPIPFIMAKQIPGQTDASENLNIKVRVKSGESGE